MLSAFLSLFFISFSYLLYEILLMRLLSIEGWTHFAYMVVSLSMLGLGFSGVLIGLFPDFFRKRNREVILAGGFTAALILPLSYRLNSLLPLNYLYMLWDTGQIPYMLISYGLYGIPFIIFALILGVFFILKPERTGEIYAVNLFGSGSGIAAGVILMQLIRPEYYIPAISLSSVCASLIWAFGYDCRKVKVFSITASALIIAVNISFSDYLIVEKISEYKAISYLRDLPGVSIVDTASGPMGHLNYLEGDILRLSSGQSLSYAGTSPRQMALTFDGDSPTPSFDPLNIPSGYFESLIYSAPYRIKDNIDAALIVGADGLRSAMLSSFFGGRPRVLELNPQVIRLLEENIPNLKEWKEVSEAELKRIDARAYALSTDERYDLIQLDAAGGMGASSAGLYAVNEDFLNTAEAYSLFLSILSDEGILMLSRWSATPPRDGIRLFSTLIEALESMGVEEAGRSILLIRNWDIITALVKREGFTPEELDRLIEFSREKFFDISYMPDMDESLLNRFHVLEDELYYSAALRIIDPEKREEFFRNYIFNTRPATDNKPYFSSFFRVSKLPYIIDTFGREWIPFAEYGYLVLTATFIQGLFAGAVLILIPLILLSRKKKRREEGFGLPKALYFSILGGAFMLLEIALIQKFILFLHDPVYSAAIVIGGFLIFSGGGSFLSGRLPLRYKSAPFILILILSLIYTLFISSIFQLFAGSAYPVKLLVSAALIAPLAVSMGMPFPMGMSILSSRGAADTGIAWGYNGFFSVLGAVATPLLSISMGLSFSVALGGILYVPAMIIYERYFLE